MNNYYVNILLRGIRLVKTFLRWNVKLFLNGKEKKEMNDYGDDGIAHTLKH